MNILQLVPRFPPYHGGMGTVAWELSRSLVMEGDTVTVATPTEESTSEQQREGVRILRIQSSWRAGNATSCRWILKWAQGYDVIHLHWPFIGGAGWLWWGLSRGRIRTSGGKTPSIVIQYHMDLEAPDTLRRGVFWFEQQFILPRLLKYADAVVTSSDDYLNESLGLNQVARVEPPLYRSIPLGVDAQRFLPGPRSTDLASKWAITPDQLVIGFVGAIDKAHYFKGIEVLFSAFSILQGIFRKQPISIMMVGGGGLLDYYQNIIRDGGLEEFVHWAGTVSDEELPEFYRLMDCVVLPSTTRSEAFGLVLLEALATARPVVASNLPGVRSVVSDGVDGRLVAPGDHEHLANTLSEILGNTTALRLMGVEGRRIIEESYQWSVVAKAWQNLYEEVRLRRRA